MSTPAEDFDAFVDATWQPLLLQTFAACGDLGVARDALQRSYVDAWHHWARARWQGAEDYVRAGAFAGAAWRTRTRPFHKAQRLTRDQRATLAALDGLSLQARRAVVLSALSDLELPALAQQIGEPEERTAALATAGSEGVATALGVPAELVATRLHALAGAARAARRPGSAALRTQGVRRRRAWLGGGVVAALVLTVVGGLLVHSSSTTVEKLPPAVGSQLSASQLLGAADLGPLGNAAKWTVASGTVSRPLCQARSTADPDRLRVYTRGFSFAGRQPRAATQAIELSRTERQARAAYRAAAGWFDRCSDRNLALVSTESVDGLGDDAAVMQLRDVGGPGRRLSTYAVGLARTGHIVTWTAVTTQGPIAARTDQVVGSLANAVRRACTSKAAGRCTDKPVVGQPRTPADGEQAGMLAVSDLPTVPGVSGSWRGTPAAASADNSAATTCDRTSFTQAGASSSLARTYLVPGAGVPRRFGLTETLGRFETVTKAKGLVTQVVTRMTSCQDRDPGAKVGPTAMQAKGPAGTSWYLWRVSSDLTAKRTIVFWMGVVRYGSSVAQVSFVPGTGQQDLDAATFQALIERARDRLYELPRS